jgi:hypothetical protein
MSTHEQITIQQTPFRVPMRYAAGHTLNDNEAAALNQTLHENLRNIWAPKVKSGLANGETPETLQAKFDTYAAEYQFGRRRAPRGGSSGPDPVPTIALAMAKDIVRKAVKAKGLGWPTSKISVAAKQLLDRQGPEGALIQTARARAEAERAAGEAAMAEVGAVLDAAA